jgi:hypothetical protein
MNRTQIPNQILQEHLEASTNALEKGVAQFETPLEWAGPMGIPLPTHRPTLIDLNCGHGQLLQGIANHTTKHLLGVDIDPCHLVKADRPDRDDRIQRVKINGDVTLVADLFRKINLEGDLFVLNPPWDLHFHRDRLKFLFQSDCEAVAAAFNGIDPRLGREQIDSTIAMLMLALNFSSSHGEGVLVANEATLQRLIFRKGAPHGALADHVWAHLVIAGNPMTGNARAEFEDGFQTGVIYFARSHLSGCAPETLMPPATDLASFRKQAMNLNRLSNRDGTQVHNEYQIHTDATGQFEGVREEWAEIQGKRQKRFNIWLDDLGMIRTYLSRFDDAVADKNEAKALFSLTDQKPMNLVMQVASRAALMRAVNGGLWKVSPELPAKVAEAMDAYNAIRAPLYPMPEIMRLAYVDEQSFIKCIKDVEVPAPDLDADSRKRLLAFIHAPSSETWEEIAHRRLTGDTAWRIANRLDAKFREASPLAGIGNGRDGLPIRDKPARADGGWAVVPDTKVFDAFLDKKVLFVAGKRYAVSSQTVMVERKAMKPNAAGGDDEVLLNGQELAILIEDECGKKRCFMDRQHFAANAIKSDTGGWHAESVDPDLSLQDLVEGFEIPDVPDVAKCHPEKYAAHLAALEDIERYLPPTFRFKQFQREDVARGAIHPGCIFGLDPGLGKTICGIALALLKVGHDALVPKKPCLIVAPGNLHAQMLDAYAKLNIPVTPLDCQETYRTFWPLKPGFYLTSFMQLARNKVLKLPEVNHETTLADLAEVMVDLGINLADAQKMHKEQTVKKADRLTLMQCIVELCRATIIKIGEGVGEEVNGVRCVYSPSLAELTRGVFECVVIDEGTKIKGEDSQIGVGCRLMDPPFRFVLTGTPIKNRLKDLFWLMWWACSGKVEATPRFPYGGTAEEQDRYEATFAVCERNLTKERAMNGGRLKEQPTVTRRRGKWRGRGKVTPEVCNIHLCWKLNAPNLLRRRMEDIGQDVVRRITKPIWCPMGEQQAEVYGYHLTARYEDENGNDSPLAKLTALRSAAAAPHSDLLLNKSGHHETPYRSKTEYIPKVAAALEVIRQILESREQVVVFSALQEPNQALSRRLKAAAIPHQILDGSMTQGKRGKHALDFKRGWPDGPPIALAGMSSMAEGNDWPLCRNAIIIAYDWAYDLYAQAIKRIHRLNSEKEVTIWTILCKGTIDRKLEALKDEKGDAAELVLDGKLLGEDVSQVNLRELLQVAYDEFDPKAIYPESELEKQWPELREKLRAAYNGWRVAPSEPPKIIEFPKPVAAQIYIQPTIVRAAAWKPMVFA